MQRLAAERAQQESIIADRQSEMPHSNRLDSTRAADCGSSGISRVLRQRREDAAQASLQRVARVAALEERHRSATAVLGRIDSLFV